MFKNVDPKTMTENPFALFADRWTLVTAGTEEHCNTMTASWGSLGILWHKKVATVYIRPQRYTMEFLKKSDYFTLSFFGEEYREQLNFCGAKSGRGVDKIKECGFTVGAAKEGAPYIAQAELVIVCKKLCFTDFDTDAIPEKYKNAFYAEKDYHRILFGEITEVLRRAE